MNQRQRRAGTTRRSWLAAAGLAATGLGTACCVLRPAALQGDDAARRAPLSLLVVSDTHLGYRDQTRAYEQWKQVARQLAATEGDLVLHLGDVVDGGREAEYPRYLEVRQTIGRPVHEIPGNHDPPDLFARYLQMPIDRVVEWKWLRILLLNNSRTSSHDGFLSGPQIDWIDGQCRMAASQRQRVLICMHVPAHRNLHPDRGWYVKPDQGQTRLYETLQAHRHQVIALLHGHFHNGLRGWNDRAGLHEICFPSALYNQDRRLEQQGAAGYNPAEFRPGFTRLEFRRDLLTLRYHPLGADPSVSRECLFTDA